MSVNRRCPRRHHGPLGLCCLGARVIGGLLLRYRPTDSSGRRFRSLDLQEPLLIRLLDECWTEQSREDSNARGTGTMPIPRCVFGWAILDSNYLLVGFLSGECWCDWIRRRGCCRGDSNDGRVRDANGIGCGDRYVIGRSVGQAANRARGGRCCRAALAPY